MSLAAITLLTLTGIMGFTAQAPAALAHSNGVSSSPSDGDVVDALPSKVAVTFDAGLMDIGAALAVVGPDGVVVSAATPTIDKRTISTALTDSGLAGTYKVAYRIVSEDGHAVEGKFRFTVEGAAAPSASQSAAPSESPSSSPSPSASASSSSSSSAISPVEPITAATQAPVAQSGGSSVVPWVLVGVAVVVAIAGAVVLIRRRD